MCLTHVQYRSNVSWQSRLETRSSILDTFENRGLSFEARVSSLESWVSSFEFWDTRRIFREKDLFLEFVTIEINNTARLPLFVQEYINFKKTSKSLVWRWSSESQSHSIRCIRKNNRRTNQPNLENAACEREMIFLALFDSSELKFQLACRMQIYT